MIKQTPGYFKNPQGIINLFGQAGYVGLVKVLDPCCGGVPGVLGYSRFVGDSITYVFTIPASKTVAFLTIDGLVQDPTTYKYVQLAGTLTLNSVPSIGTIILIFSQ